MKFTKDDFLNGKVAIKGSRTKEMQKFLSGLPGCMYGDAENCYYYFKNGKVTYNDDTALPKVEITDLAQPTNLPKAYKGEIADFPQEVVEMMLLRQVEQGNKRDVSVFEKDRWVGREDGGFDWHRTSEGDDFWTPVIVSKMWDVFFDKYPKQQQTNMNKKVLGYRLKKEFHNMNEACGSITGFADAFDFRTGTDKTEYYAVRGPEGMTTCYKALKDAGVLDLWFEPVYSEEEKIAVGDYVVFDLSLAPKNTDWSAFTVLGVTKVKRLINTGITYVVPEDGGGIHQDIKYFRKATQAEIDAIPKYKVEDWILTSGSANGWGTGIEINNAIVQYVGDRPYTNEVIVVLNGKQCYTGKSQIVRKATAAEIEAANTTVVSVGGAFNVTVKNKKVYHGSNMEDITEFVKGIVLLANGGKIAGYGYSIKDITFSQTGCQAHSSSIKDWQRIYNMIK